MIDRNVLLSDFDETVRRYARRDVPLETVAEARDAAVARRQLIRKVEDLRADLRRRSEEIGAAMKAGRRDEAERAKAAQAELKAQLAQGEEDLRAAEERETYLLLRIPNLPSDDTPDGLTEDKNVVLRTHGWDERYAAGGWRPHWEVAAGLGVWDQERASKISGAMFAVLRGDGARLLRALVSFGLDLNRERYTEVLAPHFVKTDTFVGTGHLPKFEAEAYRLRDDDLWAIPTGEVPLMGLHRDEIIPEEEMPRRYMTYTVCFRREAGSAGKDTRGMQRLHEFHKVELLKLCAPETVAAEYEGLLADAERPLQLLGLPYRVVDLCCGDLTFSSARVLDLEVYCPGVARWLEVSSVGMFTDFQTRRGNIRFRRSGHKPELAHALNGSGLATPRMWAAIIEHGQQADGSVKVPEPLVPYMGGKTVLTPG
ncbi:MAG TPA: serine--tRNA ligase [Haliangiales bacterium]|nr:serine--tRNA ligase [Haliangiales bacterium]